MKWLDREFPLSADMLIMVTCLLLYNYLYGRYGPNPVGGLLMVIFVILFVRFWVVVISDVVKEQNAKKRRQERRAQPPATLCGASTRRGSGFIKCTFPRDHIPAEDHSWTVDL